MRLMRVLAGLLLTAVGSTACSASETKGPDGAAGFGTEKDLSSFTGQSLAWRGCGGEQAFQAGEAQSGQAQCAYLRVPTDYANPQNTEQQLAVLRVPAVGGKPRGVLFVNPGGPGVPATGFARPFAESLPHGVRTAFDVVVMDPRAVGESGYLSCLGGESVAAMDALDVTPDTSEEREALRVAGKAMGQSCLERQPSLIRHLATEDFARDVEVLRSALKISKLNMLGYSYGSLLGYHYARLFPQRVGRLVLDGAVPPGRPPAERGLEQAQSAQQALEAFAEECAAAGCGLGATAGEVLTTVAALQQQLDRSPVPVTGHASVTLITDGFLTSLLLESLYDFNAAFDLAEALPALRRGDAGPILEVRDGLAWPGAPGFSSRVLNGGAWGTQCLDEPRSPVTEAQRSRIMAASPAFGSLIAGFVDGCSDWPVPPRAAPAHRLPEDVPALVISNDLDPATPRAGADRLAGLLPSAVHFRTGLWGHTAAFLGDECVDSAVTHFLLSGDTRPASRGCST